MILYHVSNEETGVAAKVIDWPTITHSYRVVLRDLDAGEPVPDLHKSFKHLADAEAYADTCVDAY